MESITFHEVPTIQSLEAQRQVDPRESPRKRIAYILLVYLGAILLAALIVIFRTSIPEERAQTLLALIFGPTVGLVGTVVGFYFGAQTAQAAAAGTPPPPG